MALGPELRASSPNLVLREYRQAIDDAETRLERLTQQVAGVVSSWSMAPVVEAYQSMRGVAFSDGGHLRGGDRGCAPLQRPRQLMAYLGPSCPRSIRLATGSVVAASRRLVTPEKARLVSRGVV